ncbi:MAG: hypothetical protein OEY56_01445 [Cyclobacteriaceae bacterium]|nr:hypothetical protein [Cyclobacteriaceae bacterium]
MTKFLFFGLLLFMQIHTRAQDTLFYTNGKIRTGQIVQIDSAAKKIAFKIPEGNTVVVLFQTINRIASSGMPTNSVYFEARQKEISNSPKEPYRKVYRSFFTKPAMYTYGPWMVSTNIMAPFKNRSYDFPGNPSFTVEVDYFFNEKFSLNVSGRFGYGFHTPPRDTLTNTWTSYYDEMISQYGIMPRFFPLGQQKFSLFFAPLMSFGTSSYMHATTIYNFTINPDTGLNDWWVSEQIYNERRTHSYSEYGIGTGILLNVTPFLNLSSQLLVYSTNSDVSSYSIYDNYLSPTYRITSNEYYMYREARARLQFHLVYRLGGKAKE